MANIRKVTDNDAITITRLNTGVIISLGGSDSIILDNSVVIRLAVALKPIVEDIVIRDFAKWKEEK